MIVSSYHLFPQNTSEDIPILWLFFTKEAAMQVTQILTDHTLMALELPAGVEIEIKL